MTDSGIFSYSHIIKGLKENLRISEIENEELEQELQQCKSEHERYNKEIKELKDGKEVHEEKIVQLQQEIEKLKEEIDNLKRELEKLNKKNDLLQEKIKEKDLTEKNSNDRLSLMDDQIKSLIVGMNRMKEESQKKDTDMDRMKGEIKYFSKKSNANEAKANDTSKRIEKLERSRGRLFIGQLCANVQVYIYRRVLPIYFDQDYRQPHVKDIDKNINNLYRTTDEKQEARGKWRKLQREIGWDPNLVDVMEGLLNKRHDEAHPHPLDDDELEKTANELPGEEQENVKKIIKILKKLEDSV